MREIYNTANAVDTFDPNNPPPLMTIIEVAELARCSVSSIHRRRKADPAWLPMAPKRFGRRLVFRREDVFSALNLALPGEASEPEGSGWEVDPVRFKAALEELKRERAAQRAQERAAAKRAAKR